MNITTKKAQRSVPFATDINTKRAVNLAIWLIIDKRWTKKNAINKAVEKNKGTKKIRIQEIINIAIPAEFFAMRRAEGAISSGVARRMVDERMSAKYSESHIKDIMEPEK